jgi:crotonobetainyl-CoA:carnitine CoA-transferase CaiB-like acyl-CoA transferase
MDGSSSGDAGGLPFRGLRVLDMTTFWAGPLTGHMMALLGAEVLHLESPSRPDGARFVGGVPQDEEHHLERSPIFTALNTNKLGLAIDAGTEAGAAVLRRVVATCDVLIENYTPRVLDQLGLDEESLRSVHPGLITVRMPGFGLDGPWRDVSAFAFVIEDASGLTWLSGHPDVPPIEPYSIGDPNAGLHALFGLQLALEHRDRTGEGGLVEAPMVEAALNIAAEQVVEHSAHGVLLGRSGNRGPLAAPQNLYRVEGVDDYGQEDNWVAIAVATDDQWAGLVRALGDPAWAADPGLAREAGRRERHDEIDRELAAWCRHRSADDVVAALLPAGVPVAPVELPHHQADLPPTRHRRFFEEVEHPVTGRSRCATLPMSFSDGPGRWHHRHAPLLGQHTAELLASVGIDDDELEALRAGGVIP